VKNNAEENHEQMKTPKEIEIERHRKISAAA
jgi:hypothetical protein